MNDLFALFADDEPTAEERAAVMTEALRQQRAAGMLGLLTGDKVLGGFGQAQVRNADQQEQMVAGAGQHRSGQRLQKTLQKSQQDFTGGQSALDRKGQMDRLMMELGYRSQADAAKLNSEKAANALKSAGDLRKELQGRPEFKEYQVVSTALDKVKKAANSTTPASDMSLIFSYMKLLDPGSTVREGEYASAQNTTGIPGQILNMYNRAEKGNFLTPQQKVDFVKAAEDAFGAHQSKFKELSGQYSGLASKAGADPADVVLGGGSESPAPAGGLSPEEAAELQRLQQKYGGKR